MGVLSLQVLEKSGRTLGHCWGLYQEVLGLLLVPEPPDSTAAMSWCAWNLTQSKRVAIRVC